MEEMTDGEGDDDNALFSIFILPLMMMSCCLLIRVGQVILEVPGHTEDTNLVLTEDGDHLGVGGEEVLLASCEEVLQLVCLDVGPEPLDHLEPGELLILLSADEVGQLLAEGQSFRSGSPGHLVVLTEE